MIIADEPQTLANTELSGRWAGIVRPYTDADVARLRGSVRVRYTLAELGAARLWELLHTRHAVRALGALTGNQAVQQVRAGLEAIYLSGWQVAADANLAGQTYPDQSLYPANSVPPPSGASTRRCSAPTRSTARKGRAASAIGSRRSWPMPRPASAVR